ncbi:unnamed protein product [Cunninghamella blakesleeana]
MTEMKYVRLGNTGLKVSRLCLGLMSYGSSDWAKWVKDEEESIELIKKAYDAGVNFFDTADGYSNGESEVIFGKAIKQHQLNRAKIVVATKVFFAVSDNVSENILGSKALDDRVYANRYGLSRKHIFDAVDASLKRLQLDYIDVLYIHRYDDETPIEETMEALHDVVKSGKVRYIGASSMEAWKFVQANYIAQLNGWTKFCCMQNLYNLIYREEEREMIPFLKNQNIGQVPWSPLARGLLTRPESESETSTRSKSDHAIGIFFSKEKESDSEIIRRVGEVAEKKGVTMSQVSLGWVLSKSQVSSAIVGIGKEAHLYDTIKALDVELTKEESDYLEEAYTPRSLIPM